MQPRVLVALPVFNEVAHVDRVLCQVSRYADHILVVDDGSTDGTAEVLAARDDVAVVTHEVNRGYGTALVSSFTYAIEHGFDLLITIDCDGQHEPQRIPDFVEASQRLDDEGRLPDIVSGSRYLATFNGDSAPPEERRSINMQVTSELNHRLCLKLTDAFCGFKAYRVATLPALIVSEAGYGMPLELWVKAAAARLNVVEVAVPLIYLEEKRSFGGTLDDGQTRMQYYHLVLDRAMSAVESQPGAGAGAGTLHGVVDSLCSEKTG